MVVYRQRDRQNWKKKKRTLPLCPPLLSTGTFRQPTLRQWTRVHSQNGGEIAGLASHSAWVPCDKTSKVMGQSRGARGGGSVLVMQIILILLGMAIIELLIVGGMCDTPMTVLIRARLKKSFLRVLVYYFRNSHSPQTIKVCASCRCPGGRLDKNTTSFLLCSQSHFVGRTRSHYRLAG